MSKSKGIPIVILGMHRSGTSVIAHMLHHSGISMGEQFLNSDSFNPKGYFEDEDFLGINKGILENAKGIWYDPPPRKRIIGGTKFEDIIKKTVVQKRQKAGVNFWGWKDPRNCLTCWRYVSEIPDARFIIVVRRLSDIKLSLNKTHGHLADWNKVIDTYYNSVEDFLQVYTNVSLIVSFEELVYEKYARNTAKKVLNFVNKPEHAVDKALSIIQFR